MEKTCSVLTNSCHFVNGNWEVGRSKRNGKDKGKKEKEGERRKRKSKRRHKEKASEGKKERGNRKTRDLGCKLPAGYFFNEAMREDSLCSVCGDTGQGAAGILIVGEVGGI
ncbi:MAG: hypothetical protein D6734_11685 [Candidatus Schekmanbacteria bacterium]|nr:MAG: hypothetical protein D6734_11685 [Candidatus Schekmanbacteria bacterium]